MEKSFKEDWTDLFIVFNYFNPFIKSAEALYYDLKSICYGEFMGSERWKDVQHSWRTITQQPAAFFNSPAKSANNSVLFQTMLGSGANVVMGANGDDAEQKLA